MVDLETKLRAVGWDLEPHAHANGLVCWERRHVWRPDGKVVELVPERISAEMLAAKAFAIDHGNVCRECGAWLRLVAGKWEAPELDGHLRLLCYSQVNAPDDSGPWPGWRDWHGHAPAVVEPDVPPGLTAAELAELERGTRDPESAWAEEAAEYARTQALDGGPNDPIGG